MVELKKYLLALGLGLALLLGACSDKEEPKEQKEEVVKLELKQSTPLETVESFMRSYYFDEGTYAQYQELYVSEEKVKAEDEFNKYREANSPKDAYGEVAISTIDDAKKHLKVKEVNETTAEVYLVSDPADEELKTATAYWIVEKVEDKWKLQ